MSTSAPAELAHLATLEGSYARGDFRERTDVETRLCFARWLVAHGRVNEGIDAQAGQERFLRRIGRPWPRWRVGLREVVCCLPRRPR